MHTVSLTTRSAEDDDIGVFPSIDADTEGDQERARPEHLRAHLSEALRRSSSSLCVLDGTSQPVALFGCMPLAEGQGAVWVHLPKRAHAVPLPALQETFTAWTKTEALERFPLLLAGAAFSATHIALLHAADFILLEAGADAPFRVTAFRRASRDPSPLRISEVQSMNAPTQTA